MVCLESCDNREHEKNQFWTSASRYGEAVKEFTIEIIIFTKFAQNNIGMV